MNILFDTNVILDVLLDRQPFADDATRLLARVERAVVGGWLCATTVTTLHYLIARSSDDAAARQHVGSLLRLFEVAPVNRVVLEEAMASGFTDFEDGVLHAAARHVGADAIVTRNIKDFAVAELPVFAPDELVRMLAKKREDDRG